MTTSSNRRLARPATLAVAATSALLTLAACGGGGGSGTVRPPSATDNLPTAAAAVAAINRITAAADSQLTGDILNFSGDAPVRMPTTCHGTTCTARSESEDEILVTRIEIAEIPPPSEFEVFEVRGTRQGIPLVHSSRSYPAPYDNESLTGYGGWLEHSYFAVFADIDRTTGRLSDDMYGGSVGRATGTNPLSGSATWNGAMVGRDVSASATRGDRIEGDAALTIADFADPRIAVAFTNITNIETDRARNNMMWSGIPLTDGSFATGAAGNSIKGEFYGPGHEEVGGVFERDQVIGAFGARR